MKRLNKNTDKEYYATFGFQTINFTNEDFIGCNLNAIFGGLKCNPSTIYSFRLHPSNANPLIRFIHDTLQFTLLYLFGTLHRRLHFLSPLPIPFLWLFALLHFSYQTK